MSSSGMAISGEGDGTWMVVVDRAGNAGVAGQVRQPERQVGDAGTEVRWSECTREGEPEEAGTLSREWVGQAGQARQAEEGGRSGCSSQTLTAGDSHLCPMVQSILKKRIEINYVFSSLGQAHHPVFV